MLLPLFGHRILATTGSLLMRLDSISATPRSVADFEETELAEHVRDKEAWEPAEAVRSKSLESDFLERLALGRAPAGRRPRLPALSLADETHVPSDSIRHRSAARDREPNAQPVKERRACPVIHFSKTRPCTRVFLLPLGIHSVCCRSGDTFLHHRRHAHFGRAQP
jgi:hypothetical protein